jgi:hypothetical protein
LVFLFVCLFVFAFIVLGGSTLWHLQRFLKCIKYVILEVTPPLLSSIPSPRIGS